MSLLLRLGACAAIVGAFAACQSDVIDPGGEPATELPADDPLNIERTFEEGSLDDIFERIIQPSCAGQEGLCHNGQFEPNLSTPALVFETVVARASLERSKDQRVVPGAPGKSLLVDKLRNRGVISRMPLGASPLAEEDIALIERWIERGAKRRETDGPLPTFDNPPKPPLFALYDVTGARIDAGGIGVAKVGDVIDFRMSTDDFEVADADIPAAFFLLQTPANEQALIDAASVFGPTVGVADYDDTMAPEEQGERLNRRFRFTVPATIDLVGEAGTRTVPIESETFTILAAYYDGFPDDGGLLGLSFRANAFRVEP